MAQCTAPYRGHRSSAAAAACPACGGRSRYGSYNSYGSNYNSYRSASSSSYSSSGGGSTRRTSKPRWSGGGSSVFYTEAEVRTLTPFRQTVERQATKPDLRHIFLCHAWDDRAGAAKELNDMLELRGVSVWFSEKDVPLGTPLMREIDRGLAKSRVGIVLVTPAFLRRIQGQSIADKELSALLARDQLIPIVHGTTYEELRDISPMLASRSGLSTAENPMSEIAAQLAELVIVEDFV